MTQDLEETNEINFSLKSVEETTPPEDSGNEKWFSYIIGRGSSIISGKRAGTLMSVTEYAQSVVDNFNDRSSRFGSIYVPRRTAKKG